MIDIEQDKIYRLRTGGLFMAVSRHEHVSEPWHNHWILSRITMPNGWEGFKDPLVFDAERDDVILREATEGDYEEYLERHQKEYDRLTEEADDYKDIFLELADLRDQNA